MTFLAFYAAFALGASLGAVIMSIIASGTIDELRVENRLLREVLDEDFGGRPHERIFRH